MLKLFFIKLILFSILITSCNKYNDVIEVDSLKEMATYLSKSDVVVKLKPGIYEINDTEISESLVLKKYKDGKPSIDYPVKTLLHFSGNNSTYLLEDVIIHINTELHKTIGKGHFFEVFISGNNNFIQGLQVKDIGYDYPAGGAIMMHVMGDGNTIKEAKLSISGSYPYGYGHLLGKGANPIVSPHKHSSLLVTGKNTELLGCSIITRGFGHGIVMQGAYNTYIKDCYVEGEMRSTDEMLAETQGPAFETSFKSDYPPGKIQPNEIKSLSEDGVRSYPYGYLVGRKTENITVINTTVKNMRSGFDLSAHIGKTLIDSCTAIGCQEKGYSVSKNAVIKNSKGDAKFGPLLSFHGNNTENCEVELSLMPNVGKYPVKRLAEINGTGHKITLTNFKKKQRLNVNPIVFGESFWSDVHQYRYPTKPPQEFSGAYDITLINKTGMPIVFEKISKNNSVTTNGKLIKDLGENNVLKKIE